METVPDDLTEKTLRPLVSRLMSLVNYKARDEVNDLINRIELGGHHCPTMDEILGKLQDCSEAMGTGCESCQRLTARVDLLEDQLEELEATSEEQQETLVGVKEAIEKAHDLL